MQRFLRKQNFSALSLRDLLEARDHYSVHLANLPNVVGTAVGRYRVRTNDKRSQEDMGETAAKSLGPRTMEGSETKSWSWPCVLVFVSKWLDPAVFTKHPECAVPRFLYMPDGRMVRTCVVLANSRAGNLEPAKLLLNPSRMWGAGSQLHLENQQVPRLGVATCMVTDGAHDYALTSAHLIGDVGTAVFGFRGGAEVAAGDAARVIASAPLSDLYPGFAGKRTQVTLDAGLLKLRSRYDWTSCRGCGDAGRSHRREFGHHEPGSHQLPRLCAVAREAPCRRQYPGPVLSACDPWRRGCRQRVRDRTAARWGSDRRLARRLGCALVLGP